MNYAWVNQQRYPVAASCRVLGVSRSGLYAWRNLPRSRRARADKELLGHIRRIHHQARENYDTRKVHKALVADALHMAVQRQKPAAGLIHHSDRGSVYAAQSYRDRL